MIYEHDKNNEVLKMWIYSIGKLFTFQRNLLSNSLWSECLNSSKIWQFIKDTYVTTQDYICVTFQDKEEKLAR